MNTKFLSAFVGIWMVFISISGLELELERNTHLWAQMFLVCQRTSLGPCLSYPWGKQGGVVLSASSGTRYTWNELDPALHQLLDLGQSG